MTLKKIEALQARVEVLEVQQAVMTGFMNVIMQAELHRVPGSHRAKLYEIYENLFEQAISNLLGNDAGFSDNSIRAIENLKTAVLGTLPAN